MDSLSQQKKNFSSTPPVRVYIRGEILVSCSTRYVGRKVKNSQARNGHQRVSAKEFLSREEFLKYKPLSQHTGTTRARTGADWHTHRLTTEAEKKETE